MLLFFPKNQLSVLLALFIFSHYSFISPLIFIIYFLLLPLGSNSYSFSSFLIWKFWLLISDFSSFLIYIFKAMIFPLSTAFTASHKVVFQFS